VTRHLSRNLCEIGSLTTWKPHQRARRPAFSPRQRHAEPPLPIVPRLPADPSPALIEGALPTAPSSKEAHRQKINNSKFELLRKTKDLHANKLLRRVINAINAINFPVSPALLEIAAWSTIFQSSTSTHLLDGCPMLAEFRLHGLNRRAKPLPLFLVREAHEAYRPPSSPQEIRGVERSAVLPRSPAPSECWNMQPQPTR
jgi:hypothetical protein